MIAIPDTVFIFGEKDGMQGAAIERNCSDDKRIVITEKYYERKFVK